MLIAAVIANRVNADGRREILGLGLGQSEVTVFRSACFDAARPIETRSASTAESVGRIWEAVNLPK